MPDNSEYLVKAEEYSRLAMQAGTDDQRQKFLQMEQSYRLLARNADWISATGEFIKKMRARPSRPALQYRRSSTTAYAPREWGRR